MLEAPVNQYRAGKAVAEWLVCASQCSSCYGQCWFKSATAALGFFSNHRDARETPQVNQE